MVSAYFKDKPANILCSYSKSPPNDAQPALGDCLSITLNIKFPTYLVQFYLQVCGIILEFMGEW